MLYTYEDIFQGVVSGPDEISLDQTVFIARSQSQTSRTKEKCRGLHHMEPDTKKAGEFQKLEKERKDTVSKDNASTLLTL